MESNPTLPATKVINGNVGMDKEIGAGIGKEIQTEIQTRMTIKLGRKIQIWKAWKETELLILMTSGIDKHLSMDKHLK